MKRERPSDDLLAIPATEVRNYAVSQFGDLSIEANYGWLTLCLRSDDGTVTQLAISANACHVLRAYLNEALG